MQDFAGDALEATINTQKLSYKDVAKAYTVLSRPFFNAYPEFYFYSQHLSLMLECGRKFEVEALCNPKTGSELLTALLLKID